LVEAPEHYLDLIVENDRQNIVLMSGHHPKVFTGDLTLIVSNDGPDDRRNPLSWRRYVTGDIGEYSVDSRHAAMLRPESIRLYGSYLRRIMQHPK
jgi:hypothetical protein